MTAPIRLCALPSLLLLATPASAEHSRAALTVSATVAPTCQVESGGGATCSDGSRIAAITAARLDERPLDEAHVILGAPARQGGAIRFRGPVRPTRRAPDRGEPAPLRFHTISY
jgi:hypothetical protein